MFCSGRVLYLKLSPNLRAKKEQNDDADEDFAFMDESLENDDDDDRGFRTGSLPPELQRQRLQDILATPY